MTSALRPAFRSGLRSGMTLAVLLASGTLMGCGEDANETALRDAGHVLAARHPSVIVVDDKAGRELTNAISSLRGVVSDGSDGQKAAANLMIARAQQSLAMPKLASINDAERASLAIMADIENEFDLWLELNSIADAAEVFEPSELLRENQQLISGLNGEIERVRGEIASTEQRVAELESQASDLNRQAEFEGTKYGEMLDEALRVGAVEALSIRQEAHDVRRRSETLYANADRITAEAEQVRPEIVALQIELAKLEGQRKLLEEADTDLRQRRANAVAEASKLRSEAAEVAQRISSLMSGLDEMRESEIAPEREELLKLLNDASRAARSARGTDADSASLVMGELSQAIGDVHRLNADASQNYFMLLSSLVSSEPVLPNRSDFVGLLEGLEAEIEEARTEASDAYSEASNIFGQGSRRVRGQSSKRRLETASDQLDRLSGKAQDEVIDDSGTVDGNGDGEADVDASEDGSDSNGDG